MSKVALFLPDLCLGGAERVMVCLANGLAARGRTVDMVLVEAKGEFLDQLAPAVRVVDLKALIFSPSAGVFSRLRDAALFAQVRVEIGAPVWPGDIDIAPDAIYDGVRSSAHGEYRVSPPAT